MKIKSSIKVALVVLGTSAVAFFGYRGYSLLRLKDVVLTPINPGRISLVAINAEGKYKIVVANQLAQLVESSGSVEDARSNRTALNSKRLPIRELVQSLELDDEALAKLIMNLNDIREDDMPAQKVVWRMEDLDKAFAGDAELKKKLERDLHVGLDGIPPAQINLDAIINGIVLDYPVKVQFTIGGQPKELVARVQEPFQAQFAQGVWAAIEAKFNPPKEEIIGLYRERALAIMDGKDPRQDIPAAIKGRYAPARLLALAKNPGFILSRATVLLNESFIESATKRTHESKDGQILTDIEVNLTDEGRDRLWKYSFDNRGFQLLLIVDGVAIAAPRISTELPGKSVSITQLPNEGIAADAVDLINTLAKKKTT